MAQMGQDQITENQVAALMKIIEVLSDKKAMALVKTFASARDTRPTTNTKRRRGKPKQIIKNK